MHRMAAGLLLCLQVLCVVALGAEQPDPCATFTWNVSHERALFSGTPDIVKAGATPASAPQLETDRLYALSLLPLEQVRFPVALARKKPPSEQSFAGIARLKVAESGSYRLSFEEPFWVDIVQGGKLIEVGDHQGRPGCKAPHKVLQFSLPARADLVLEVMGAFGPQARMTITRTPAPAP